MMRNDRAQMTHATREELLFEIFRIEIAKTKIRKRSFDLFRISWGGCANLFREGHRKRRLLQAGEESLRKRGDAVASIPLLRGIMGSPQMGFNFYL